MKVKYGFSIIELLVVVAVFSILAALATQSLVLTLRGSRKSESMVHVRENVDYAFAIMERNLHNAKSIDPAFCGTTGNVSGVAFQDAYGNNTYFFCDWNSDRYYIASGSGDLAVIPPPATDWVRLTSDDVRVTTCTFICSAGTPGVPDSVDISVTAQAEGTTGAEGAQVTTSTKILLRTY